MRPTPSMRLTPRGRATLLGLCLLLAALGAGLAASASQASHLIAPVGLTVVAGPAGSSGSTSPAADRGETVVVVGPGDTLWSIAAEHAPSRDPYGIIEEIRRRNDLPDHTIHAGQELTLP